MNPDPNRRNPDAVPVTTAPARRGFNLLWLLPLLLLPLLMLPFCTRRDADRAVDTTRDAATNTADAARKTGTVSLNPFTVNTTGRDAGKAVLNFEANATTPNTDTASALTSVVAYLKANPAARVSLKGYTDNSGSAEVNQRLTQQRIETVKSALIGAGVDASRIAAANFGEAYPVTDNSNPQARELNRRVEIELAR